MAKGRLNRDGVEFALAQIGKVLPTMDAKSADYAYLDMAADKLEAMLGETRPGKKTTAKSGGSKTMNETA